MQQREGGESNACMSAGSGAFYASKMHFATRWLSKGVRRNVLVQGKRSHSAEARQHSAQDGSLDVRALRRGGEPGAERNRRSLRASPMSGSGRKKAHLSSRSPPTDVPNGGISGFADMRAPSFAVCLRGVAVPTTCSFTSCGRMLTQADGCGKDEGLEALPEGGRLR